MAREIAALPMTDPRRVQLLRAGLPRLVESGRWNDLEAALTDLSFLESKTTAGLISELIDDFALALEQLPPERPARRVITLLEEALRLDRRFIAAYPVSYSASALLFLDCTSFKKASLSFCHKV